MRLYVWVGLAYFAVVVLLTLWALSDLIFSKAENRVKQFFDRLIMAVVWPFAALSAGGRNKLMRGFE